MKYWRLTFDYVLNDISYQNIIMLNASIPRYDKDGKKKEPPKDVNGKDLMQKFKR